MNTTSALFHRNLKRPSAGLSLALCLGCTAYARPVRSQYAEPPPAPNARPAPPLAPPLVPFATSLAPTSAPSAAPFAGGSSPTSGLPVSVTPPGGKGTVETGGLPEPTIANEQAVEQRPWVNAVYNTGTRGPAFGLGAFYTCETSGRHSTIFTAFGGDARLFAPNYGAP
jgi:hypothetical protein